MNWIQANWNIAAAIVVALIWAAKSFGPSVVTAIKSSVSTLLPKVQQNTTVFSSLPLLAIGILLSPYIIPAGKQVAPVAPVRQPDIVDQCGASGRSLLADELVKFSGQKFDTDQAKENAINDKIADVIEASFEPLNTAIAEAIKANRVTDLADKIRKGELR